MQYELEAKKLYSVMQWVNRYGSDELGEIADHFYNAPTSGTAEDILIGGWRLDDESYGGIGKL